MSDDANKLLDEVVQISQEAGLYDMTIDIRDAPPAITAPVIDEYEIQINKWCNDLRCKLIDKYRKGKEEHGDLANGKPLDCAKEISNEVADILIYHCIDVVQKGKG